MRKFTVEVLAPADDDLMASLMADVVESASKSFAGLRVELDTDENDDVVIRLMEFE